MTKEERLKAAEAAYPEFPNEPKGETRYNRDIHCHKKRKAFIKGAEAEADSKWISVEVELPKSGSIIDLWHIETKQRICNIKYDITFILTADFSHWMYAPQPPLNQQ